MRASEKSMRMIILGMGRVASSFCNLLIERQSKLKTLGINPILVSVVDQGGAAINDGGLNILELLETKRTQGTVGKYPDGGKVGLVGKEVLEMVNADLLIDLTSTNLIDGQPSLSNIKRALTLGINVVTANKGPLALEMPTLLDLAKANRAALMFSATVGAATPFLSFARKCLDEDDILGVEAILNGTCNFILSRMEMHPGSTLDEALTEARRLGYAERDPSLDIDGLDTAAKLVILANLAMKKRMSIKDVEVEGIRKIRNEDLVSARSKGRRIKLIGNIGLSNDRDSSTETPSVKPKELNLTDPLCVEGNLNAVRFKADLAGDLVLVGVGAGGRETASAVLRDILEIGRNPKQ
jgi:homoserine dehydrogenase